MFVRLRNKMTSLQSDIAKKEEAALFGGEQHSDADE